MSRPERPAAAAVRAPAPPRPATRRHRRTSIDENAFVPLGPATASAPAPNALRHARAVAAATTTVRPMTRSASATAATPTLRRIYTTNTSTATNHNGAEETVPRRKKGFISKAISVFKFIFA